MAGGIYTNRPFEPNIKCIIFGFSIVLLYITTGYLTCKKFNYYFPPFLFIIAYIAMAWYDMFYDCSGKLYSGNKGLAAPFDSIFKPQRRSDESQKILDENKKKDLANNQEEIYKKNVYLFHILVVSPILIYVGIKGSNTPKDIYPIVLTVGISALIYHGYRIFRPRKS
jgi:hypothetical protein